MARGAQPRGQTGDPEQRGKADAASQILSRRYRLRHAGDRDDAAASFKHRPQTSQRFAAEETAADRPPFAGALTPLLLKAGWIRSPDSGLNHNRFWCGNDFSRSLAAENATLPTNRLDIAWLIGRIAEDRLDLLDACIYALFEIEYEADSVLYV